MTTRERNGGQPSADETTDPPRASWLREVERLDVAVYAAIARQSTPRLDDAMRRLSSAADHSKLWIASAGLLSLAGGRRGRRAAAIGLGSVAVTSAIVNAAMKPALWRGRPDRVGQDVPAARHVPMPTTGSFPSGHAASAMAFSTAISQTYPRAGAPLSLLAYLVAYSRIHTGVHYPGDVLAGSLTGAVTAFTVTGVLARRARHRGRLLND